VSCELTAINVCKPVIFDHESGKLPLMLEFDIANILNFIIDDQDDGSCHVKSFHRAVKFTKLIKDDH